MQIPSLARVGRWGTGLGLLAGAGWIGYQIIDELRKAHRGKPDLSSLPKLDVATSFPQGGRVLDPHLASVPVTIGNRQYDLTREVENWGFSDLP